MSVYTCLFSSTLLSPGRFRYSAIVGWKKFIQTRDMKDDGTIITFNPPQAIFNNPGQYVFPGGRAKPGEEHFDGALREFGEETGVLFTRDGAIPAPGAIGRASFWTYTNLPQWRTLTALRSTLVLTLKQRMKLI